MFLSINHLNVGTVKAFNILFTVLLKSTIKYIIYVVMFHVFKSILSDKMYVVLYKYLLLL